MRSADPWYAGRPAPEPEPEVPAAPPVPVRLEVAKADDEVGPALVASLAALLTRMEESEKRIVDALSEITKAYTADREGLLAALTAAATAPAIPAPEVIVNIPQQEAPVVNVEVPKQPTPEVNVTLEAPAQATTRRHVTFTRNLEGRVEGADIEEVTDGG